MSIANRTKISAPPVLRIVLLGGVLAFCLPLISACAASPRHTHADDGALHVTVLDSASGRPLPRIAVQIYSDNGIRCIKAPCPTNGMQWNGRTDKKGVVVVPAKIVQSSMTITATGHVSGKNLAHDASKTSPHDWVIALDRDR